MLMFSQLIRGTARAIILTFDYWAPVWQGGEHGCFPFALFVAEGCEHSLAPALGAGFVASIYNFTLGFFTLLLSYCLLLASCATSFLVKASW